MLFNNIKSQYDVKMLIIIDFCAMNIDQIRSLNDTNGILTVIHRRTKIQLILLLNFELKSVRIMSLWIFYIDQLSLQRTHSQSYRISLVIVPWCILLIDRRVLRPAVSVIRNLISSMRRCRLEFELVLLYFLTDRNPNWHPSFYSLHLELYRPFMRTNAWLNQRHQRILVIGEVGQFHFFGV